MRNIVNKSINANNDANNNGCTNKHLLKTRLLSPCPTLNETTMTVNKNNTENVPWVCITPPGRRIAVELGPVASIAADLPQPQTVLPHTQAQTYSAPVAVAVAPATSSVHTPLIRAAELLSATVTL